MTSNHNNEPSITTADAKQALTLEQVAGRLSLHPNTVRRLVMSGELPAVKVGRQWRFDPDVVASKLNAFTQGVTK